MLITSTTTLDNAATSFLPIEPTPETGPNDDKVVWAPGKFFFTYSLLVIFQLTYIFHALYVLMHNNEMTSGQQQWPLSGP